MKIYQLDSGRHGPPLVQRSAARRRRGHARSLKRFGLCSGLALAGDLLLVLINHGEDLVRGDVSDHALLLAAVGFISLFAVCYYFLLGSGGDGNEVSRTR